MSVLFLLLGTIHTVPAAAQAPLILQQQFVPNSQSFWDNSKNWTSDYGPAYRDTMQSPSELLACDTKFALCFHSGPQPLPCTLSADGRSANCKCTVANETNYTLINAILNYPVYLSTIRTCGADGSNCPDSGDAPVCRTLNHGTLIPGANVISTFDPASHDSIVEALESGGGSFLPCPKGPYAACMTAPCHLNPSGSTAQCKCPVFYGKFQLLGAGAKCDLGGNLVNSASYSPLLEPSFK